MATDFNNVVIIDERTDGISKKVASPRAFKPKIVELSTITVADGTIAATDKAITFLKNGWSADVSPYMLFVDDSKKPIEKSLTISSADTAFYSVYDTTEKTVYDLSVRGSNSATGYPIAGRTSAYPSAIVKIEETGEPRELKITLYVNAKDRDLRIGYIYIYNPDSTLTNTPAGGIQMKVLSFEGDDVVIARAVKENDNLTDITTSNKDKLLCRFSGIEDPSQAFLIYKLTAGTTSKSVYKIFND